MYTNIYVQEEEEKMNKVKILRRLAEKSLLSLVTTQSINKEPLNTSRWNSVHDNYFTDLELFNTAQSTALDVSSKDNDYSLPFPSTQLIEMITLSTDIDLGNRGIRIMAALLEGIINPDIRLFGLDPIIFGKLSNAVQARMSLVLEAIEAAQLLENQVLYVCIYV
jgi:hypothetical protein